MGLRICLSLSITGLIAAEQVGTREGIGYLVTLAQEYNRTDYMVLCVVLYAALVWSSTRSCGSSNASRCPGVAWRWSDERGAGPPASARGAGADGDDRCRPPRRGTGRGAAAGVRKSFGDKTILGGVGPHHSSRRVRRAARSQRHRKTTLLRLLTGLERPDGGEILVPHQRTVVYQEPRLIRRSVFSATSSWGSAAAQR